MESIEPEVTLAPELVPEIAPEIVPADAPVDVPVDAPVSPVVLVKRPRGRPRKNPEEPKRPRGRPRKNPEAAQEVRFEEPEIAPVPVSMPDAVCVLAQVLLQNEAEARRRKAERYKNMLGL